MLDVIRAVIQAVGQGMASLDQGRKRPVWTVYLPPVISERVRGLAAIQRGEDLSKGTVGVSFDVAVEHGG
ncbi:hypothetical protein [Nocardia gamkensis]|uniref:hypothetical protein n=1 Tax=Nocardia gamkensis TaxID=352869 RepID=UPI0007A43C71|nr:hypothetical protein [Nocardia gamkensis]